MSIVLLWRVLCAQAELWGFPSQDRAGGAHLPLAAFLSGFCLCAGMFYRKCRFLQKHRIRRSQEREGVPGEGQGQSCRVLSTAPTWFGVQGFQLGQLLHLHLLGQVPCGTQGDSSALCPAAGTLGGGTLPLGTPSLPLSSPRAIPAPLPAGICAKIQPRISSASQVQSAQ